MALGGAVTGGDPLGETLTALAERLQPDGIELIVGGGYGLVLRARQLARERRESRYDVPLRFRSTADIDCFLSTEIITDGVKTARIAAVLAELGFLPREPYFIFERTVVVRGREEVVEIDLLASDVGPADEHLVYRRDDRRIRPKGYGHLHARRTPEAVTVERGGSRVDMSPTGRGVYVTIPHPASFILMKLFAFRDRTEHEDAAMRADAPYHAFDVFMTLASMNAEEWEAGITVLNEPSASIVVHEAGRILHAYFDGTHAPGVISLVDYANVRQDMRVGAADVSRLTQDLAALFAAAIAQ